MRGHRRIGDSQDIDLDVVFEIEALARIALTRARFEEALALLTEHEHKFPAGIQRGERELLIVRALLGTSNRGVKSLFLCNRLKGKHRDSSSVIGQAAAA
ncbi:hypothetical protein BH11MYX1_BH11MYX1_57940 [soil metagenome]